MAAMAMLAIAALSAPAQVFASVPGHERAWELMTPAEPVGASVGGVQEISADGSRVVYNTAGSMPGAAAGDLEATNLAIRGADGWSNSPLAIPYSSRDLVLSAVFNPIRPLAFDADLEPLIWLSPEPLVSGAPVEGRVGLYRVQPDGALTVLADIGKENEGEFVGASEDASHVVFSTASHLLPGDAGRLSGKSIYEVVDGAGERLVDVDSDGNLLSTCGSAVNKVGGVSRSGNQIFFTNPAPSESESCPQPSHVYLREGGSETIDISASQCTRPDCNAPSGSTFAGATPSGSSVFIASNQQLTNADHDELGDLYRYDVDGGGLSLISEELPGVNGAVKASLVRASVDGSRVYFAAAGRLLPGQGSEEGENLYFADAGGLHFVASTGGEALQVSRDGRVALIETAAALKAGDTDGRSDVYLWSADTGTITRLSKGVLSDNGDFDAQISSPLASQAVLIGHPGTYRSLTEGAQRAFFSTAEQLIPEDRNEVTDVYEWADGGLGLVSSGTGSDAADFAGASAEGQTVLFKTAASLLPTDRDGGARDLYAARLGGGFPLDALLPPSKCGADACQPTPRRRLVQPIPATTRSGARAKQGRLSLLHVDPNAGISISSGDPLKLRVRVPGPGRISGEASMRVGEDSRVAARGDAGAVRAGKIALALHVTPAARTRLQRLGVLRVRLVLHQAQLRLSRTLTLRLGGTQ